MTAQYVLSARQNELKSIIQGSFNDARSHTKGFALRILGSTVGEETLSLSDFAPSPILDSVEYGGFPGVACLGFRIGADAGAEVPHRIVGAFASGLERLQDRQGDRLQGFRI